MAGALAFICSLSLVGCSEVSDTFKGLIGDKNKAPITATVINHTVESKQDGVLLATGNYAEIVLSDDSATTFPNLNNTLKDYNNSWAENCEAAVADYAGYALEATETENSEYTDSTSMEVVRADSKLFTLLGSSYINSGGAHPSHYFFALNLDVKTGHVMNLSEVVKDKDKLVDVIRNKVYEKYPENKEEIENYFVCACASTEDAFKTLMDEDTYTWTLTDEGLHIYFSPYEIASYAAGDMDVVITEKDLPDFIQDAYKLTEPQDLKAQITYETAEAKTVEPNESQDSYGEDEDYSDSSSEGTYVENPTWHKYISSNAKPAAAKHITLTETSKDKSDWLNTDVWREKNGFDTAFLSYGDGNYYYAPGDGGEYGYEYTTLFLYDYQTNELLHTYDLSGLCNGPDSEENRESHAHQYIHWAKAMDGVLYVSLGHNGYASEESWSNYMAAIDMATDTVLWRSEPLVSNAMNFQIVDDTIICGYGFTAEPDYLYLLDKNTGEKVDQIKLESGPEQFEIKDDTLYVATYNTAYTYKINR